MVIKKESKNNSNYLKGTTIGAIGGIIVGGIVFGLKTFKAFPSIVNGLGITGAHTLIRTFFN